jgi:hypothetical protein
MAASHVFVETTWVVDSCAPVHRKVPAALELLNKAADGTITLHIPGVCLTEARSVIRRKFHPRSHLEIVRTYLPWARDRGSVTAEARDTVRAVLDAYENEVVHELESLEETLANLRQHANVKVFPLTEKMLERALTLGTEGLELQPFDQSILAAILIRATELKENDQEAELFFCEYDRDLLPWDREGNRKPAIAQLYDDAHIWVYGDFTMTSPVRPPEWAK